MKYMWTIEKWQQDKTKSEIEDLDFISTRYMYDTVYHKFLASSTTKQ